MRRVLSVAALLCVAVAPSARAQEPLVAAVEKTLENGLQVLVHEDHDIPNVALYVFWRVGSRNERPGITGIAHMFEHMMFMGGRKYGRDFDPTMEAAGGSNNAYTSNDVTVYQDWFPSSALPLIVDMEADRMSGMVFDPDTVESERGVVASERRLNMEEPSEVMREQLWAAAYTAHPYQWSVLGWMVDIENWTKKDLEDFFATHYAPQNATMVIVGDVTPEKAFALVEEKMGGIPRGRERPEVTTTEPEQKGERRVTVENASANVPQLMSAWHIPATGHTDFAVVAVLERILMHGRSSRLHRLLVEDKRVCISVGGGFQGHQFDPSLFTVDSVVVSGGDTAAVEKLVYAELDRLAESGPGAEELAAAKTKLRANLVRRMKTIAGKAELLGESEVFFGGWENVRMRLDALAAVTKEDVQRVLRTYFTKRNRTVCTLVPTSGDDE